MKEKLNKLFGLNNQHIDVNFGLHHEVVPRFLKLSKKLSSLGCDIKIVSGFRSFEHQLSIWNNKAQGKRQLLDSNGEKLNYDSLSKEECLDSILKWSAIPGASRHHWGTDFDIYDNHALPQDYIVKLTPEESSSGGPFFKIHNEIDLMIKSDPQFDFFRPYSKDLGGVGIERWHLSYKPLSNYFFKLYDYSLFKELLESKEMKSLELLELVKYNSKEIFDRYIHNITI